MRYRVLFLSTLSISIAKPLPQSFEDPFSLAPQDTLHQVSGPDDVPKDKIAMDSFSDKALETLQLNMDVLPMTPEDSLNGFTSAIDAFSTTQDPSSYQVASSVQDLSPDPFGQHSSLNYASSTNESPSSNQDVPTGQDFFSVPISSDVLAANPVPQKPKSRRSVCCVRKESETADLICTIREFYFRMFNVLGCLNHICEHSSC